jgi:hypothetical protein
VFVRTVVELDELIQAELFLGRLCQNVRASTTDKTAGLLLGGA